MAWHEFIDYASITENVVFAENFSVKSIGRNAFWGFSKVTHVEIPDGVTSIEDKAFYFCWDLTSVTLPASLKRIGNGAFCSIYPETGNLRVVKVLSDRTSDDKHYIQLGDSESKSATGSGVFSCDKEATLVYDEDKMWIGDSETENLRSYFSNFVTSTVVTNKGWSYDANTKTLTLSGDDVAWHEITDYVSTTENVVLAEGFNVETIPGYAFSGFSKLAQITIPECVTSIEYGAFYKCSALTTVTLPASLYRIEDMAFYECDQLKLVKVLSNGTPDNKHYILLGDGGMYATGKYVFPYCAVPQIWTVAEWNCKFS